MSGEVEQTPGTTGWPLEPTAATSSSEPPLWDWRGIAPAEASDDAPLLALGADLRRLRRRCQRLRRKVRKADGGTTTAWARWSHALDEKTVLIERITRTSANSLEGVAVKMQAIASELLDDDLVMDEGARRRLAAVSRELGRLVLK